MLLSFPTYRIITKTVGMIMQTPDTRSQTFTPFWYLILFSWHQDYRLHMARYLLIDVWLCARSRKHILSKRKQVHTSDIAHSQMQTDAICGKIDIHITVLAIEVYGNKSAYGLFYLYNAKQVYTAATCHCLDHWDSEGRSTSTQSIRSEHEFAIHSQGVELPDFTVSTWNLVLISLHFPPIPACTYQNQT